MSNATNNLRKTVEMRKRGQTKENNWSGFAISIIKNVVNLAIITIIGSNLLYAIKNYTSQEYLPTNPNLKPYNVQGEPSIFKSFPYAMTSNPENLFQHMQNWGANTIKHSWIFSRSFVSELLKSLGLTTFSFKDDPTNDFTYTYVIKSLYLLFSPFIALFTMMAVGTSAFFSSIYYGAKQSDNIIYKFLGAIGGYNIGIINSIAQSLWVIGFLLFKPLCNGIQHVKNNLKYFNNLLIVLFLITTFIAAFNNLDYMWFAGVSLGLIFLYVFS